jgi:lysophospholipase L1-like esterase
MQTNSVKLLLLFSLATYFISRADTQPIRILPLGDSITEQGNPGYRYELWKRLIDANVSFDFVGSMQGDGSDPPAHRPAYKGKTFDCDHEGHSGWTASDIVNGCSWEADKGKLPDWLQSYTPDVVLLHIGTNDAFHLTQPGDTLKTIGAIIDQLRTANPRVIVLVAKIIPLCGQWEQEFNPLVLMMNDSLDAFANAKKTRQSPVLVVDQFAGFNPEQDTNDDIHPNVNGQVKMARVWADTLLKVVRRHPSKIGRTIPSCANHSTCKPK